jgi:VWFA-related protein
MRTPAAIVVVLGALGAVVPSAGQVAPQQPPVQFEARADLVLVDANVLDDKGMPIARLTASDFIVTVDGKPRPLASVQFVKEDAPAAARATPAPTHYSTNEGAVTGRDIIIVVDENSLPPAGGRAVLASVDGFLGRIGAADRVAFVRMPDFVGSVDFTTDRAKVRDALKRVQGRASRKPFSRVSVGEAAARERGNDLAWEQAIARACGGATGASLEACVSDLVSEAMTLWSDVTQRARQTVNGLRELIRTLKEVPGPKTLLLLSQGFSAEDSRQDVQEVARLAAEARVSIYVLQMDLGSFDIADAQPSATRMEDDRILAEGLDTLSGAARGARFRIVGSGEGVLARVARELSGYYLLGFEPTDDDRDGKPHRIRVEVNRPDVTVRARAQFTVASATAAAGTGPERRSGTGGAPNAPADRLVPLLRAPTADPGLPLRVSAYTVPADAAGRVRIIIGAEIGAPTKEAAEMLVGFVFVDADGKVAANQLATVKLQPSSGATAEPLRFVSNAQLPSGEYTLRLAAIDPEGRRGSVHHSVHATLPNPGGVSISDLIVTEPLRGQAAVRPEVHLRLEGPALQAMLELGASDPRRLNDARVTFEVAENAASEAIVRERGRMGDPAGAGRPVSAVIDVGVLPPGSYVARAVVAVPGEKPVTMTRPFEIAPRRAAAGGGAEGSRASARSLPRMRPPIPPFRKEDVLAPEVVRPFVDHVIEQYSPSPAALQALEAIKAGDLQNATRGEREISDVGMSFAQGLSHLAAGRIREADTYFRAALRGSSDFIGAAFYLGATLAAAGQDRDAVGAWQTALISEVGAAGVYPVLIDGLLRIGDAEQALEFLKEAEPTFTDRSQYTRRLAQAYALAGRYSEAGPLADEYLAGHPDDADMLFLAMHLMYERHATGETPDAAQLARFRDYATRYEASARSRPSSDTTRSSLLVVQGWRKALGAR